MKICRAIVLVNLFVCAFYAVRPVRASGQLKAVQGDRIHSRQLRGTLSDLLFPQLVGGDFGSDKEFAIVVRFTRSLHVNDSQIEITKYADGHFEVSRKSLQRSLDYYIHLSSLKPDAQDTYAFRDVTRLAKEIPVVMSTGSISPSRVTELIDRFAALRVSPFLETGLYVDGTRYDLWFITVVQSIHYTLRGGEVGSRSQFKDPLIEWMNTVFESTKNSTSVQVGKH